LHRALSDMRLAIRDVTDEPRPAAVPGGQLA
jgi:hypothetical protein